MIRYSFCAVCSTFPIFFFFFSLKMFHKRHFFVLFVCCLVFHAPRSEVTWGYTLFLYIQMKVLRLVLRKGVLHCSRGASHPTQLAAQALTGVISLAPDNHHRAPPLRAPERGVEEALEEWRPRPDEYSLSTDRRNGDVRLGCRGSLLPPPGLLRRIGWRDGEEHGVVAHDTCLGVWHGKLAPPPPLWEAKVYFTSQK